MTNNIFLQEKDALSHTDKLIVKYSKGCGTCILCDHYKGKSEDDSDLVLCANIDVAKDHDSILDTDRFIKEFTEEGNIEILNPKITDGLCHFFKKKEE